MTLSEFILAYGNVSYPKEELEKNIEGFIKNNTLVVLEDKSEIVAVCLWNNNDDIAEIEEIVIHPKHRKKGLMKYICVLGVEKFPFLKWLKFCRDRKYEGREPRMIEIAKFIRR